MSTVAVKDSATAMPVNGVLLSAAIAGVKGAFTMCGITARCVGAAAVPVGDFGKVAGMIGVHGKVSGFITVNLSERIALQAANGLLQETFTSLNSQVVDATGEITNMVVGGIKSALSNSPWSFSQITVPSMIIGQGYSIAYSQGLEFINVIFEHEDKEALLLEDRFLQVSISLLTL